MKEGENTKKASTHYKPKCNNKKLNGSSYGKNKKNNARG